MLNRQQMKCGADMSVLYAEIDTYRGGSITTSEYGSHLYIKIRDVECETKGNFLGMDFVTVLALKIPEGYRLHNNELVPTLDQTMKELEEQVNEMSESNG